MKVDYIEYLDKFGVDLMFAHYINHPKSFVDEKHDFNFVQNYVINSGKAYWIFEFANMVKKADKNKLQSALINLENSESKGPCLAMFAKYIKGADWIIFCTLQPLLKVQIKKGSIKFWKPIWKNNHKYLTNLQKML